MPNESASSRQTFTLSDLVVILMRWRRVMVLTFLAVLVPAAVGTFLMPPLYEATATIVVSRNTSAPEFSVKPSDMPELSSVMRTLERKEEVNAKIQVLKSRATVEPVIDTLSIDERALDHIRDVRRYVRAVYKWTKQAIRTVYDETKYTLRLATRPTPEERALFEREKLVTNVLDRLRVTNLPDSTVIEASFRSSDPLLATKVVNQISDNFIARDAMLRDAIARGYFNEASERRAAELRDAESRLEAAKRRAAAYASEDQRRLLLTSLSDASDRLKTIGALRARLTARIAALNERLRVEPDRVTSRRETNRDPALDDLRRGLVELEMERATAVQQFLPDAPVVQDLDARIREARELEKRFADQLEGSVTTEINPVREHLRQQLIADEVELAAAIAEEGALETQVHEYRDQLSRLSLADLELAALAREVRSREEAYTLAVRNRQQADLSENMASASLAEVQIVDYASLPLWPIRPRKWLYLGIALAAALVAALVAPFFAEFNSAAFTSSADVRSRFGSLVVASFPSDLQLERRS